MFKYSKLWLSALKICVIVISLCHPIRLISQSFHDDLVFKTNTTLSDSIVDPVFQLMNEKYTFIVSLEVNSYWMNETRIRVIALDEFGKYKKILLKRNKGKGELDKESQTRIQKKNNFLINEMITYLTQSSILALDRDSLNINTVLSPDTVRLNGELATQEKVMNIPDGVIYRFNIITQDDHRIISCAEPEKFYSYLPEIYQRKTFIEFLDKFNSLWESL